MYFNVIEDGVHLAKGRHKVNDKNFMHKNHLSVHFKFNKYRSIETFEKVLTKSDCTRLKDFKFKFSPGLSLKMFCQVFISVLKRWGLKRSQSVKIIFFIRLIKIFWFINVHLFY